jgi:hypothetical protein
MSILNVPHRGRDDGSPAGHTSYHDVYIGGNARAHLGDTYHNEIHLPPGKLEQAQARPC